MKKSILILFLTLALSSTTVFASENGVCINQMMQENDGCDTYIFTD